MRELAKSLYDPIIGVIFLSVILLSLAAFIQGSFRGNDDNVAEEALELLIKDRVGFDIDITPLTPEYE